MQGVGRWFLGIVCLCRHNHPGINNCFLGDSPRIQRVLVNRSIVHVHRLIVTMIPQILRGASNSNRIGWLMKISLALMQSPLTSASVRLTFFPGLLPLTLNNLSMMLSTSISPCLSLLIINFNVKLKKQNN